MDTLCAVADDGSVSLDVPFYEELRRRGHPAARIWLVGDCLLVLGQFTAAVMFVCLAVAVVGALAGWFNWYAVLLAIGLCAFGVAMFLSGGRLKGRSYRLAVRDGIHVDDY